MKRKVCSVISIIAVLFAFFSCENIESGSASSLSSDSATSTSSISGSSSSTTSTTASACYTSGTPIEVATNTVTLTVTGDLGGKTIYLAKTNPTSTVITSTSSNFQSRCVSSASSNITLNTYSSSSKRAVLRDDEISQTPDESAYNHCGLAFADEDYSALTFTSSSRSASSASTIDRSESQLTLETGTTTKTMWTGINSSYTQEEATLRATGTYCNVWVVSDSWTSGEASDGKINAQIAAKMAAFFDDIYELEQTLYGAESDQIFYADSSTKGMSSFKLEDMEKLSVTGTKVNLVVSDIPMDNVYGYFSSKDYYPDLDDFNTMTGSSYTTSNYSMYSSNEGKYLYIDAPACVEELANVMTIITHEFQHLITFGRKTINHFEDAGYKTPGSAYYEMMAMVGEDFMKEYNETYYASDGFTTDNTPFTWRLPTFNAYYYLSGAEYRGSSDSSGTYTTCSYATNYAFGAWLARTYGGAAFINHIVNSSVIDYFSAICDSILATTGDSVTTETLLRDFAYAVTISKEGEGFRHEIEEQTSGDFYNTSKDYGFPLSAVDLYNLENYGVTATDSNQDYLNGPTFFYSNTVSSGGVRPYGIELNKIGTIADGETTISLTFNENPSSSLKTYVIIE